MNKIRRHKIKKEFKDVEKPTASTAATSAAVKTDHFFEQKDLTHYLHDRVELMHQIFSIFKPKELMAMAPDCIRNLNIDDIQELCLEEVLGISSKRLCAILDGAEPPSDTETSSSDESAQPKPALEQLETISLDSISSDEVEDEEDHKSLSSKGSQRKKHSHAKKHKHNSHAHHTPAQPRAKDKHRAPEGSQAVDSKVDSKAAERAGMTVLELLELQARARAIRAQLALENTTKDEKAANSRAVPSSKQLEKPASSSSESENENSSRHSSVCIKEEPPEVLEVPGSSSEDEKTVLQEQREKRDKRKKIAATSTVTSSNATPTSLPTRKSDLTVIVPQTQSRKIKLKRNKVIVQVTNIVPEKKAQAQFKSDNKDRTAKTIKILENADSKKTPNKTAEIIEIKEVGNDKTEEKSKDKVKMKEIKTVVQSEKTDKSKKSKSKKSRNYRSHASREGSDHDEITLQLSDTEKMDLLENFNPKNYENVSSSSSNEESEEDSSRKNKPSTEICVENPENDKKGTTTDGIETANKEKPENNTKKLDEEIADKPEKLVESPVKESVIIEPDSEEPNLEKESTNSTEENTKTTNEDSNPNTETGTEKESQLEEIELKESDKSAEVPEKNNEESNTETEDNSELNKEKINPIEETTAIDNAEDSAKQKLEIDKEDLKENKEETNKEKEESPQLKADTKSDGEISEKSSSDIEMLEKPPEIICISDEEEKETAAKKLKKNKKEKKAKKKSKKHSKKSDFRKAADRDFPVQRKNVENLSATDNIVILDDAEENLKSSKTVTEQTTKEETSKEIGEDESERRKFVTKETMKEVESGKFDDLEEDVSDTNYEIYEISDESSGSETDLKLLSKEPTSEEIEELSQRIDTEIEREEIISEDQIRTSNMQNETNRTDEPNKDVNVITEESGHEHNEQNTEDIEEETMSWKYRWLGSKKVQKVMVTSNILNAIRKKNKELKLKLAQRKNETELPAAESEIKETTVAENVDVDENLVVEGSIDHYNTLEGSTKYVDPVTDTKATELDKSMRKDAKQLMRMYKKLVKAHSNSNKSESERNAKKERKKARREKRKALDAKNVSETELNKS